MKRILMALLLVCLPALAVRVEAQNYSAVTASGIRNGGALVPQARVCFLGTNAQDQAINFQVGGGGLNGFKPFCAGVTNGAVAGGFQVPNPANTLPAGIYYHITIKDSNTQQVFYDENCVSFSGAGFNMDTHTPVGCRAGTFTPPTGSSLNGPFTVNGNVTWTGMATGNLTGNLTGNADTATSATKDAIRDKGFVNVVDDCGLPTNGISDSTSLLRTCRALYPGRHFIFPKLRAYNDSTCDYQFNSAILTTADTNITGEWYDGGGTSGMGENFPSAVKLCFAAGVTAFEIAGTGNTNFRLSNLHLYGNACYDSTNAATQLLPFPWSASGSTADGIRFHARANIEHVWFECFGRHGVNLDTEGYVGNMNDTAIYMSRATQNRGVGLFIRGADSNISTFIGFDSALNQMDGIVDFSQLGNVHIAHHTSTNGNDGTANGTTVNLNASIITSNYATMTATAPHGLLAGDSISQAGTVGGRLNGRFQVLDVPSATTYVIYTPQQDRASTVETATVNKRSAVWAKQLTGCSITNGSVVVTCNSGGLEPAGIVGYPISIIGAGVAGADLNTRTVLNGSKTFTAGTTWSITSNVLTIASVNTFTVGQNIKLFGFDVEGLDDHEVQIATDDGVTITAPFTHADVASHADAVSLFRPLVQVADAASTTVTGAAGTILYRPVAYRSTTNGNGNWLGNYMEADQNAALFSTTNIVLGGTMTLDTNSAGVGPSYIAGIGGVTTFRGQQFKFDAGNRVAGISVTYEAAKATSTLQRFSIFDTATMAQVEKFRIDHSTDQFSLIDIPRGTKTLLNFAPLNSTASFFCTAASSCTIKQGSDTIPAAWEWRSSNTIVASMSTAGVGKFSGLTPFTAGGFDLGSAALPWSKLYLGTAATNNFVFTPAATAAARTVAINDPLANSTLRTEINATATVDLASVATAACSADSSNVTVTGARLGDPVKVTAATALEAGGFLIGRVTASDTARYQFCNLSGGAIDRASDTYTVRVQK